MSLVRPRLIVVPVFSVLSVLLALSGSALLNGCGSGDSGGGGAGGSSMKDRLDAAYKLLDEAEGLGAAQLNKSGFDFRATQLDDAAAFIDKGEMDNARTKITSAERGLRELIRQAEDFKTKEKAAQEEKKKAEAAIAEAKKNGVDKDCRELFQEAMDFMTRGNDEIKDPLKIARASANYKRVVMRLIEAESAAKDARVWKEKAETQLKATKAMEGRAVEGGAEKTALVMMVQARQFIRDGQSEFDRGRYAEAHRYYQSAERTFAEALKNAMAMKEFAKGNTPSLPETPAPKPGGNELPLPEPVVPEPAGKEEVEPAIDLGAGKKATGDNTPAVVAVEGSELSPEDEEFLQRNISKFFSKISPTYDAVTGEITLEYNFGEDFKKDLLYPTGVVPSDYLGFKDILGIGKRQAKGQNAVGLVFTGNTRGFFLLPVPFKDTVTIEYFLEIMMMKTEGAMTAIFLSSPDGKNYYGANFATLEVWSQGRPRRQPSPIAEYRKSANYWFSKVKIGGVPMRITCEPFEGEKDKIKVAVYYDTDEHEQPANVAKLPGRSGLVGFSWYMTKFNIRQLSITGKLDKKLAVKYLREKLGDTGSSSSSSSSKKEPVASKKTPKSKAPTSSDPDY